MNRSSKKIFKFKNLFKFDTLIRKISLIGSILTAISLWLLLSLCSIIPAKKLWVNNPPSSEIVGATPTLVSFLSVLKNGLRWKVTSGFMAPEDIDYYICVVNKFWVTVFILSIIPFFLLVRLVFFYILNRVIHNSE